MSRHRNVRSMRYSDEYDGYDDVYGHSVEDDYSISPSDAAFMYDRSSRQPQISSFLTSEDDIAEEEEGPEDHRKSALKPELSEIEEAKLRSCLDETRNVIGDTVPEQTLIDIIIDTKFDIEKTLDRVLNKEKVQKKTEIIESPKPQRPPRNRHIERDDTSMATGGWSSYESIFKGSCENTPENGEHNIRTLMLFDGTCTTNAVKSKNGENVCQLIGGLSLNRQGKKVTVKKAKPSIITKMIFPKEEEIKLDVVKKEQSVSIKPFLFDVASPDEVVVIKRPKWVEDLHGV